MLKALGKPSDPRARGAVAKLQGWRGRGAHREDADGDHVYEDAEPIALMDAWWPRWVAAQFERPLGKDALGRARGHFENGLDNHPNFGGQHRGSAWQGATYSYVQKDLRAVLGRQGQGPLLALLLRQRADRRQHLRCCRGAAALDARRGDPGRQGPSTALRGRPLLSQPGVGPPDPNRMAGSQWCFDAIFHQVAAALYQPAIDWQNRPTWQQAVEVERDVPRSP